MSFIVTPSQLNRRAELYHQLGSMLSAGLPLVQALEMASVNPAIRGSRKTILGLLECLQSGMTFGQSLGQVKGWIPEFDVALLATGEQSGRLDASFRLLSNYYSSRAKIIRDTIAGLLMTAVTLHVFLLVFPIGTLTQLAQGLITGNYALCIPFILQKAIVFGCLYGGALLLISACQGRHGERWRSIVESFTQRIPVLKSAQKYLALSRLSAALEALINAGISIITGWELSAAAAGSPSLRRQISKWRPHLESGSTPGEMVNQTSYFPQMFGNLYNTGEISGQLDDTLRRLQVYYEEEGFRLLRLFTRILNGVIYGGIVIMIGYNIIRFWMNYFGAIGEAMGGL